MLVVCIQIFGRKKTHITQGSPVLHGNYQYQLLNRIFFWIQAPFVGKTSIETAAGAPCQGTIDRTGRLVQTDPPAALGMPRSVTSWQLG